MACDEFFADVVALLHFDGADGSATFTEVTGKTVTGNGNAQIDTAKSVFGGASLLLDGAGDYLSIPSSTDFDLGDTYTIEMFVNPSSLATNFGLVHRGYYTVASESWTGGLAFGARWIGSALRVYFYGTVNADEQYIDVLGLVAGTSKHLAIVRDGTVGTVYIGGDLVGTKTALSTPAPSLEPLRIGVWDYSAGAEYFSGNIDELRITKGVARYTAAFTPPTAAFGNACVVGTAVAATALAVTATGDAVAATALDVVASTGVAGADTALTVTASGITTAPTDLTIEASTGPASALSALTVTASGTASAPSELTVEISLGAAVAFALLSVEASVGPATAPTALTMEPSTGTPTAPSVLTVSWPSGAAAASTALTVSAVGAAVVPTLLAVIGADHAPNWTARCLIDGVDVSAQLEGVASVTAEEGAARIAQLTLRPPAGVISPLDYVGKTILIDYVLLIDGVPVPRRLFTGRIDTPHYDPDTTRLQLDCTDDLQNRVAALPLNVIAALVGGRFSEAVQGETDDHWDYALARLSTVAASLDAGADGGMRVTPWSAAATWATWGAGELLYQRMSLTLPQRSTLVNRVDIAFDYRYPRLRQRTASVGWSGTQAEMLKTGYAYPTQQDILGAAGGSGWTVTSGVFWPAPAGIPHSSGGFVYPAEGSIDMAVVYLAQRHSQTITEGYELAVTAPESIAANGELAHALRGALESRFDGSAWESALDVEPLMSGSDEFDYSPDAPRGSADYAMQTLLDQARVKILGSHRSARVGNAVLCNPDLDVDKRVAIATDEVEAAGKVASVVHTLDFQAGSAVSAFEIAIFGAGGAGILGPDILSPPLVAAEDANDTQDWGSAVPPMFTNIYGSTPYQEGLMGLLLNPPERISVQDIPDVGSQSFPNPSYVAGSYPVTGFRVGMPGVDDASRNPRALSIATSYSIVIPPDPMTFIIP